MQELLIDDIIAINKIEGDVDKTLIELRKIDAAVTAINKRQITLGNISSVKELQAARIEMERLSATVTNGIKNLKNNADAFSLLEKQVSQAERNMKKMVTLYGEGSEKAQRAAASLELLRSKLKAVNDAAKNPTTLTVTTSINNTDNLSELEEERKRTLNATGDAVSDLERKEALAANTATAMGTAQKEAATESVEALAAVEEQLTVVEQLAQTIVSTKAELAATNAAINGNAAAFDAGTISEQEYIAVGTKLTAEQTTLKNILSQTQAELNNQVKTNLAAAGSLTQLALQLSAAKRQYEGFTEAQKSSAEGQGLLASIQKMDAAFKEQKSALGENQAKVGDYEGAIKKAIPQNQSFAASANEIYSIIRRVAQILPGVGIATIFAAALTPIENAVKELINYESAEDRAKRATTALTDELKFQNDALTQNKNAIRQNTDEIIAELKRRGATQDQLSEAERAGLSEQETATERSGKKTIENINHQITAIQSLQNKIQGVKTLVGSEVGGVLKFNIQKLDPNDVQDLDKVNAFLKNISAFKESRDFAKLPEEFKSLVTNLETTGTDLSKQANDVLSLFNQRRSKNVNQIAADAQEQRAADRQSAENTIAIQADQIERSKKAKLDELQYSTGVRRREFDALKAQIIAQRDFELNAEKDKIQKINALRAVKLSQPELSAPQRQQINADADREIAAAKLTQAQRAAIRKAANAKLADLDKEFQLREAEAQKAVFVLEEEYHAQQLDVLSKDEELSLADRLAATKKYAEAKRAIIEKETEEQRKRDSYQALTPEEKLLREKEYENKILQLSIDTDQRITENLRLELAKQKGLREESINDLKRLYDRRDLNTSTDYSKDVIALNNALLQKKISQDDYDKHRKKLDGEYKLQAIRNTEELLREELSFYDGAETFLRSQEAKLQALREQLANAQTPEDKKRLSDDIVTQKQVVANAKDAVDKKIVLAKQLTNAEAEEGDQQVANDKERKKESLDNFKKFVDEAAGYANTFVDLVSGLSDASHQKTINQYEQQKETIQDRYDHEAELIRQTVTDKTQQQKQLDELDKKRAAQQRDIDQQEKQEKQKQAEADKVASLFKIQINTARAVVEALPNVPLSVLAGLIGETEFAIAAATPVPRYYKGRSKYDTYVGLALVDDAGVPELIERADGTLEIGTDKPRFTTVAKGDAIYPNAADELLRRSMINSKDALIPLTVYQTNNNESLEKAIMQNGKVIVRAIRGIPPTKTQKIDYMKLWFSSNESGESFRKRMNGN